MSNLFFWIIVLSFLIPIGMRWYKKSVRGRNQSQDFNSQYPGQFPGQQPGRPNNQPRDGYTQQDYFSGGFRQLGDQQQPPLDQPYQNPAYPPAGYQNPGYPASGYQNPGYPASGGPGQVPYEDSPRLSCQPVTPGTAAAVRPGNSPAAVGPPGFPRAETRGAGPAVQQRRDRHGGIHGPSRRDHEGLGSSSREPPGRARVGLANALRSVDTGL